MSCKWNEWSLHAIRKCDPAPKHNIDPRMFRDWEYQNLVILRYNYWDHGIEMPYRCVSGQEVLVEQREEPKDPEDGDSGLVGCLG
mgnify:CR=1 FL=1